MFLIFLIIETLISLSVLAYINNSLDEADNNAVVTVPSEASNISFSYDHRYVQYIQDGKLIIWDMNTNNLAKEIDEKSPIVYSYFLNDRNIITYFVKSDISKIKTYPTKTAHAPNKAKKEALLVKTINLNNKEIADYGSLAVNDFQKIDQVVYSSFTNVIYVNISVNNSSHNIIYKINVMKQKQIYETGKTIKNMVLLQNEDKLLYEDDRGNIYMNRKRLNFKDYKSLQLLGSDTESNIYFMPYGGNEIVKINGQKIVNKITLNDGRPNSVINNKSGIFLVYDDYIIDIVSNPASKITYDKGSTGSTLLNAFNHTIYTLNNKNEINIESNMF